jgi:uncharacterized membrane protein YqjE
MDDQATLRNGGRFGATGNCADGERSTTVVGSLAGVTSDMATLVELQAKLAALDARESAEKAALPLSIIATGVALALAALPVALLGVADLVALVLTISIGTARLMTAAVALVMAGALVYLPLRSLSQSVAPLRRSRDELVRNLAWVKTVLLYSGRSNPRRRV